MTIYHNTRIFLDRRRELRRRQTDAEMRLWHCLRNRRFQGLKFCRQYGVGPYILDFYCHEIGLGIELDGSQHVDQFGYDAERTAFLSAQGVRVIRFWNHEVIGRIESVLEAIDFACFY